MIALTLAAPIAAIAADAAPPAAEAARSEWIRPEEVPSRADALFRRLEAMRPDAVAELTLAEIDRDLPTLRRDLEAALARAADTSARTASLAEREDVGRELAQVGLPLARWKEALAAERRRVAGLLDEIARDQEVWAQTRARPETSAAGEVVVRRVESTIVALERAATDLRVWRARLLGVSDEVIERAAVVDAALEELRAASVSERASLFVPDQAPLWNRGSAAEARRELPRAPAELRALAASTADYVTRDARPLLGQALLALVLVLVIRRFASAALGRLAGEDGSSRAARLLERPYAIALLLVLMATPLFHPLAPRRFMQLVVIAALVPAARIVAHAAAGVPRGLFAGLLLLLLLDRIGLALEPLPALARVVFLVTLVLALALAAWCAGRIAALREARWLRLGVRAAMVGLAVALLAEVGGWTHLATLVGRGVLASAIAGLYIYAAVIALAALAAYAIASPAARRSYLVARNAPALRRRVERGLRVLGIGTWLFFVATGLGLRATLADALGALLGAGISVGALSLSVGGLLSFVLTLLTALLLARVVTGVLEEDVYPRTRLPRGVPYALSAVIRYGFYSLGFLFALAAAGVEIGQVTIMLGGLGIGIGLGLQDLVKNFAAGLTLLFERRVHVGDSLEMHDKGIFGSVLSIGMRASVVRTWGGAEVVVPNADLVSGPVTNWTLSDRLCRIELPVGVAYGSDPERVIARLLDTVRADRRFLAEPAPQALFKGFGESSLDFVVRAWIDGGYEQLLPLTSELALAVHRALDEAGISIPFPQRDLHLVSVSPAARAAIAGDDREK